MVLRFNLPFLGIILLAIISGANAQDAGQRQKARSPVFRVTFYVDGQLVDTTKGVPARTQDFRIGIESPDVAREKVVLKKAVVTLVSGGRRIASYPYYPNLKTPSGAGWNADTGNRIVVDLSEVVVEKPGEAPVTVATRTSYTIPVY